MNHHLDIEFGQYSHQGRKACNQDACAAYVPQDYLLQHKGGVFVLADGISSSNVSHLASQTAVNAFISDYYSTPETWSVKTSAERVLNSVNSWLYAQTRQSQYRFDKDRGYVSTFSGLIVKGHIAHVLHIGDARIYRLQSGQLEQLTTDHRVWLSAQENYLSRALGVNAKVDIDYQNLTVYEHDIFLLMTDGVYEYCEPCQLIEMLQQPIALEQIAQHMVEYAYQQGSDDNLTAQIIRIRQLPQADSLDVMQQLHQLAFAPGLSTRMQFDGYHIIRELHGNHRSHLYLAQDMDHRQQVVIKVPALEIQQDQRLTEQFLLEEWVAKRINSPYVMSAYAQNRPRHYIYHTMEYIEGQTLKQWLRDQNLPIVLQQMRTMIEQVAKGLQSMHRLEILHQDIRPDNLMIDSLGTVKIIDFGSCRIAGIRELERYHHDVPLGTLAYMAPEYFLMQPGSVQSDQYSLAVLAYYMLTDHLPYATDAAKCKNIKDLKALNYHSALIYNENIPAWIDAALEKALSIFPEHRYQDISEFIHDLKYPNPAFAVVTRKSLLQKNPVRFWQTVSAILLFAIFFLLNRMYGEG